MLEGGDLALMFTTARSMASELCWELLMNLQSVLASISQDYLALMRGTVSSTIDVVTRVREQLGPSQWYLQKDDFNVIRTRWDRLVAEKSDKVATFVQQWGRFDKLITDQLITYLHFRMRRLCTASPFLGDLAANRSAIQAWCTTPSRHTGPQASWSATRPRSCFASSNTSFPSITSRTRCSRARCAMRWVSLLC